jgi:uncharacterized DUF497 family protein
MPPFDPAKDLANREKHGVSLADGPAVLADPGHVAVLDVRADYGEDRFVAYGRIGDRVHVAVYTLRDGEPRFISLRRANDREIRRYLRGRP